MRVAVTATPKLEDDESDASDEQNRTDDRVLGVLDARAELQSDHDEHGAERKRDEHVRDPGKAGEASDTPERVALSPCHHRKWNPVVGHDRVAETDPGGGGDQCWRGRIHNWLRPIGTAII
jgi:hypothetical protein